MAIVGQITVFRRQEVNIGQLLELVAEFVGGTKRVGEKTREFTRCLIARTFNDRGANLGCRLRDVIAAPKALLVRQLAK
jgi:hypothetical protein